MSCPDPSMHKKGEKCPYKTYKVKKWKTCPFYPCEDKACVCYSLCNDTKP